MNKKILVVATQDARKRHMFISEPLKLCKGMSVEIFQMSSSPIKYLLGPLIFSLRSRGFHRVDRVILCGCNATALVWMVLCKLILNAKFTVRMGGHPTSVHESVIRSKAYRTFGEGVKARFNYMLTKVVLRRVDSAIVVNPCLIGPMKSAIQKDVSVSVVPQYVKSFRRKRAEGGIGDVIRLLTVTNLLYREKLEGTKELIDFVLSAIEDFGENYHVIYDILGGGVHAKVLCDFIDSQRIARSRVRLNYHGFVERASPFYEKCDIFIYSSTLDSLPNVVIDAQSYGLPILINSSPSFRYFLEENRNAIYFRCGDRNEFIAGLKRLVEDADLRGTMGSINYQDAMKKYSIEAVARKLDEAFRKGVSL